MGFKTTDQMPPDGRGRYRSTPDHYVKMLEYFEQHPDEIIILDTREGRNAYFWFNRHPEHNVKVHKRGDEWFLRREATT